MNDDPTGFTKAPDRYTAGGTERETIDEMRDLAYQQAVRLVGDKHDGVVDGITPDELADELFAYHCDATALKYERRKGRTPGSPPSCGSSTATFSTLRPSKGPPPLPGSGCGASGRRRPRDPARPARPPTVRPTPAAPAASPQAARAAADLHRHPRPGAPVSPGLKLVLAPLVLLVIFTGWVALQSLLSAAARSIAAQARLDALQAEARARGWRLERSSLYWAAWVGPAGPIIVKYVGTVDRWRRLSDNHAPLEGEADALEAALKENP